MASDKLGYPATQKRPTCRIRRFATAMATAIAIALSVPAAPASAAQVLELPTTTIASAGRTSTSPDFADDVPPPPPVGVGSISDYESQDDSISPQAGSGNASRPYDRNAQQAAMQRDLIIGAVVLGLMGLEWAAARHR